jgi:Protein of unknown function (DUF2971)
MANVKPSEIRAQILRFNAYLRSLAHVQSQPRLPPNLYHYTNAAGLVGIISSNTLYATESRYMNDSSEGIYAHDLVEHHLLRLSKTRRYKRLAMLKADVGLITQLSREDVYVTCFCEDRKLLNQWRVYAGNQGYAIGFNTASLKQFSGQLCRVTYNRAVQNKALSNITEAAAKFLDNLLAKNNYNLEMVDAMNLGFSTFLRWHLTYAALGFKDQAFSAEKEWRLTSIGSDSIQVRHRSGPYGLTPFVLHRPHGKGRLPVTSVTHGPTTSPANAEHAIKSLLVANHYDLKKIKIDGSPLPIRFP